MNELVLIFILAALALNAVSALLFILKKQKPAVIAFIAAWVFDLLLFIVS